MDEDKQLETYAMARLAMQKIEDHEKVCATRWLHVQRLQYIVLTSVIGFGSAALWHILNNPVT